MPSKHLTEEEKIRYTRHFNVPEIGEAGQLNLNKHQF